MGATGMGHPVRGDTVLADRDIALLRSATMEFGPLRLGNAWNWNSVRSSMCRWQHHYISPLAGWPLRPFGLWWYKPLP